ncbi:hypothetical protein N806_20330 [Rhodococcus sp. P27]|nr:hypothetical protein N806_20330 [Rhodococcus sp. P27]
MAPSIRGVVVNATDAGGESIDRILIREAERETGFPCEIIDKDWCIAAPIITPAYIDHVIGQIADELGIELPEASS